MRLVLNADACTGHGRCYALAPMVFDADDEGHCVLRVEGELADDLLESARKGVANCPECALSITE